MNLSDVIIRPISENDSIDDLTDLLHRSYKQLADIGLKFVATHQDSDITRRRIAKSNCFVALYQGRIIGTINLYLPGIMDKFAWYRKDGVALFGQFAVDPDFQKQGIGELMVQHLENFAVQHEVTELSLDTAEQADHLIAWYKKLGYRFIDYINWDVTNYRSVIYSKNLIAKK